MKTGQTAPAKGRLTAQIGEINGHLTGPNMYGAVTLLTQYGNSAFRFEATNERFLNIYDADDNTKPLMRIGTNGYGLFGISGPNIPAPGFSLDATKGGNTAHIARMLHNVASITKAGGQNLSDLLHKEFGKMRRNANRAGAVITPTHLGKK